MRFESFNRFRFFFNDFYVYPLCTHWRCLNVVVIRCKDRKKKSLKQIQNIFECHWVITFCVLYLLRVCYFFFNKSKKILFDFFHQNDKSKTKIDHIRINCCAIHSIGNVFFIVVSLSALLKCERLTFRLRSEKKKKL